MDISQTIYSDGFSDGEEDEYKVDLQSLVEQDDDIRFNTSPIKKSITRVTPALHYTPGSLFDINTPELKVEDSDFSNANGLFQVTRSLSPPKKKSKPFHNKNNYNHHPNHQFQSGQQIIEHNNCQKQIQDNLFGDTMDDEFFAGQRLNNSKIDKLVHEMKLQNGGDNFDYELDDQLRTRIYQGRFKPMIDENLDQQLSNYLAEDKENLADPLMNNLHNNSGAGIIKSGKVFFRSPRRRKDARSLIPVLKPISVNNGSSLMNIKNNTNIELKPPGKPFIVENSPELRSPKRICAPRKTVNWNLKSALKYPQSASKIYIVDSSTGSINDATQFGTELNASNCEGFPLPEDTNEIVQIPTNDETVKSKQKMAIIKAFNSKQNAKSTSGQYEKLGFYTNEELEKFMQSTNLSKNGPPGTQIIQRNKSIGKPAHDEDKSLLKPSRVKWADQIEW